MADISTTKIGQTLENTGFVIMYYIIRKNRQKSFGYAEKEAVLVMDEILKKIDDLKEYVDKLLDIIEDDKIQMLKLRRRCVDAKALELFKRHRYDQLEIRVKR